jgi:hypothetical protein
MWEKLMPKLPISSLICIVLSVIGVGGANPREKQNNSSNQSPDATFSLSRSPENPKVHSLVISDSEEHTISGNFSLDQLQILRAIMTEAEKFALNGETVGAKDPLTTRFTDKHESAFIVDVEKVGNQSRLFLTLKTEIGRTTILAGRVLRNTRREDGFFFDLLSRLESLLPKLPTQSPK